ncbi:hypothetical protein L218DRAFT_164495 [Marasmius fiardii PR-910]|nr:hypothetical protein L218DRAFT_164495 [Marasmius fiardii PR-910]
MGLFHLSRRQRRKTKGQIQSLSRESAVDGDMGSFGDRQYHYRSSRVTPSMTESSKDGVSIDSSYFPKSHYTKSPPHSPRHSFSAPLLPSKYQATSSPLSSVPYSAETEAELGSNQGTLTSLSTVVPSTSASESRQNTTDSTIFAHSSTHPGHGFRIHPSRFIEGLSLSPTYLESLMAGGDSQMVYQEPNEIEPENPSHPHQGHDHEHEQEHGQSSSPFPEAMTPTHLPDHEHDHDHEEEPPHSPSLPPSSPSPHDSPYFATPSQTPNPGTFSPSSSPLSPASLSAPHLPYAHTHTPTTPTSPPPLRSRSWVTPNPFMHQTSQTAEEDEHDSDSDTPTAGDSRARFALRPPSHSPSQSRSRSRSRSPPPSSDDHGGGLGAQYGSAV